MEEEKINDIIKAEVFTNCYSSIQIYLQIFMYDSEKLHLHECVAF